MDGRGFVRVGSTTTSVTRFLVDKMVGIAGLLTSFSACLFTRFAAGRGLTSLALVTESLSVSRKTLLHFVRIIRVSVISESPRIWS